VLPLDGLNPRWRPAAIMKTSIDHISVAGYGGIREKIVGDEYTVDFPQSRVGLNFLLLLVFLSKLSSLLTLLLIFVGCV